MLCLTFSYPFNVDYIIALVFSTANHDAQMPMIYENIVLDHMTGLVWDPGLHARLVLGSIDAACQFTFHLK